MVQSCWRTVTLRSNMMIPSSGLNRVELGMDVARKMVTFTRGREHRNGLLSGPVVTAGEIDRGPDSKGIVAGCNINTSSQL
jgi:hypothetical protein